MYFIVYVMLLAAAGFKIKYPADSVMFLVRKKDKIPISLFLMIYRTSFKQTCKNSHSIEQKHLDQEFYIWNKRPSKKIYMWL